jgi:hypothetical protein
VHTKQHNDPHKAIPTAMTRRRLLAMLVSATPIVFGLTGCNGSSSGQWTARPLSPVRLRLLAEARWPHRIQVAETPTGGLSGIDFDAANSQYLLLSDDRSDLAPVRFYTARWPDPAAAPPEPLSVVLLQRPGSGPWPGRTKAVEGTPVPDPESLRLRPATGTILWSSEGDLARGFGPALYESTRDGRFLREFTLPSMFKADLSKRRGPRDNLGFEGLALTPDGRHAWLAMENALVEDGPVPTLEAPGGPCRFTQIDLDSGRATRQIAYIPDAIPQRPTVPGGFADNGVSEVLMIDAHRLLVLERAYAVGVGNSLRLYEIDTSTASDVLALDTLTPSNHLPANKTLVADFATLGLSRLDNSEGMCWGPPLANGHRTLVVVSDDNFNPLQITQFAAFEFIDRPMTT